MNGKEKENRQGYWYYLCDNRKDWVQFVVDKTGRYNLGWVPSSDPVLVVVVESKIYKNSSSFDPNLSPRKTKVIDVVIDTV